MAEQATNPNDYKVVTFTNKTDFAFTPALGCMYDSRPIFGKSGESIDIDEVVQLPYHVGYLLAKNLAKAAMNAAAPAKDEKGIPTGVPLWDEDALEAKQASYITVMYSEDKPTQMSETDKLMAKVEEYKALVDKVLPESEREKLNDTPTEEVKKEDEVATETEPKTTEPATYSDKADVIAELEKRNIKFDARKSKAVLEKLLA